MVFIKHVSRGLEIPGGHREPGESPLECFKREIREETGISSLDQIHLLAYQELKVMATRPEGYQYPYPLSYQCFFTAEALEFSDFVANLDSEAVGFIPLSELKESEIYRKYSFLFDLVDWNT